MNTGIITWGQAELFFPLKLFQQSLVSFLGDKFLTEEIKAMTLFLEHLLFNLVQITQYLLAEPDPVFFSHLNPLKFNARSNAFIIHKISIKSIFKQIKAQLECWAFNIVDVALITTTAATVATTATTVTATTTIVTTIIAAMTARIAGDEWH